MLSGEIALKNNHYYYVDIQYNVKYVYNSHNSRMDGCRRHLPFMLFVEKLYLKLYNFV